MANQNINPTLDDLRGVKEFHGTYEANLICSQLRAACALLEKNEEYGALSTKLGETSVDVSFILRDTIEKMDRLRLYVDELELGIVHNNGGKLHDKITGGRTGVEALRNIERISERTKNREKNPAGLSMEEWWQIQDSAINAMHDAAGPQNAFMTGFLATIAEFVTAVHDGGVPDLDKWKPEAVMTESEKAESRARFAEEVTASMA